MHFFSYFYMESFQLQSNTLNTKESPCFIHKHLLCTNNIQVRRYKDEKERVPAAENLPIHWRKPESLIDTYSKTIKLVQLVGDVGVR